LAPVDWSQRHIKRIPKDLGRASSKTLLRLLRALVANGDKPDLGNIIQWMGPRSLDLELFPFKTHLVDLRAYRVRLMGLDRTRHQSCFSFPTEHQSHLFGPDNTMQFNNSGQRATSQKGSSTLSAARIRMPAFYANSLAVQRSLGCAPSAGIGLTQLQNTVPGGCFSTERLKKRELDAMLYDWKSASQLGMDRYPAARRLSRRSQRLQFLTGKFTMPGTVQILDLVARAYSVARTYERWQEQRPAEPLDPDEPAVATNINYKRGDSRRRIVSYGKEWFRERRHKTVGSAPRQLAKRIARHFKTGLKAARVQRLQEQALDGPSA